MQRDIHKEMFPVYGGKGLSRKAVHNWVEKHGRYFSDDEEFETEVRKWLRQQSKTSMFRVSNHCLSTYVGREHKLGKFEKKVKVKVKLSL
jgi:hypothetical protein